MGNRNGMREREREIGMKMRKKMQTHTKRMNNSDKHTK
jgi:hypothetical protein